MVEEGAGDVAEERAGDVVEEGAGDDPDDLMARRARLRPLIFNPVVEMLGPDLLGR